MARKASRRERGQALVLISTSAIVMFGAAGLVVDIGWARYRQQVAQAAAESAALAAAQAALTNEGGSFTCSNGSYCQSATACGSPPNNPPVTNIDNGCLFAKSNGFTPGGNSGEQSVTMAAGLGAPPNVPGLTNSNYWVTATIKENIPQLFSAVLGNTTMHSGISVTAAVLVKNHGACVYTLDPAANNSFSESGGSTSVTTNCGVYVNSSGTQAMVVSGGATLTTTPDTSQVVGSLSSDGNITPVPATGAPAFTNPLATIQTPTIPTPVSCDQVNYTLHGGSATISSGTYCGGITNQGGALTFNSGLYILYGGGLTSSSSSGSLTGSGVTFYNTQGTGYSYSPIVVSGGGTATLSPMTTGAQAGMLFFEDPSITSGKKNVVSGGSSTVLSGVLYFKHDPLEYSGGSSAKAQGLMIVADTVTFSGSSKLTSYTGPGAGNIDLVALVQ